MRLALALLVAFGSLAGCTTKYDLSGAAWKKPDTGIQAVTLGEVECVRASREAGRTPDLVVGGLADIGRLFFEERQRSDAFKSCMVARGFQPS